MEQRRRTNIIMPSMLILKGARVAAHWNNEATLLIQQRDYSNAAATLTTALITLREALNTTTTAPSTSSSLSSSSSSLCCMNPSPLCSSHTMSISSSTSNEEHEYEGTNSMMMDMETSSSSSSTSTSTTTSLLTFLTCCNKPEQDSQEMLDDVYSPLPPPNTTLGSSVLQKMMIAVEEDWYLCHAPVHVASLEALVSSPRCVEIVSYSIIYNLGLCHHLAALCTSTGVSSSSSALSTLSTSKQLQRAVSFYHHAQRLLACAYSFNPCMNVTMHTMILTNNMGHAYYFLNEELVAKRCFQTLLIAIFRYPSMSLSSRQESLREQPHYDEVPILECFLSNIMHFLLCIGNGKPVAAPAA